MKKIDKAKVTWGPIAAIFGSFAVLVTATILALLTFPGIADENSSFTYKFISETVYAGLIVATTIAIVKLSNGHYQALGIKNFKNPKTDLAQVIKVFFIYLGISLVTFYILSFILPENILDASQDLGFGESVSGAQLVLVALSLIVVVPIAEEVLFRGFLFKGLRTKLDFWPAAITASAIFGLAHFQLNVGLDVGLLALGACWLLEKTGSIYASILLHSVKNLIAFLLVFVVEL